MNHLHLQETARHYANLAEQYRSQLAEEQELNEDLLGLVEALCEELDIDVEALFENMDRLKRLEQGMEAGKVNFHGKGSRFEKEGRGAAMGRIASLKGSIDPNRRPGLRNLDKETAKVGGSVARLIGADARAEKKK
jgi:TolA-binding protein